MGMRTYAHLSKDKVISEMKKLEDVKDLTETEKEKYEKELAELRKEMQEQGEKLKNEMEESKRRIDFLCKELGEREAEDLEKMPVSRLKPIGNTK